MHSRKRRRASEAFDHENQTVWLGSDNEDYGSPAKRREACRRARVRFEDSQQRPPFLLSATLKGPLDEESGWQNPWRSKGRSVEANAELQRRQQGPGIPRRPPTLENGLDPESDDIPQRTALPPRRDLYWSRPENEAPRSLQSISRVQRQWAAGLKERKPLRGFKTNWIPDQTTATPTPATNASRKDRPHKAHLPTWNDPIASGPEWSFTRDEDPSSLLQAASPDGPTASDTDSLSDPPTATQDSLHSYISRVHPPEERGDEDSHEDGDESDGADMDGQEVTILEDSQGQKGEHEPEEDDDNDDDECDGEYSENESLDGLLQDAEESKEDETVMPARAPSGTPTRQSQDVSGEPIRAAYSPSAGDASSPQDASNSKDGGGDLAGDQSLQHQATEGTPRPLATVDDDSSDQDDVILHVINSALQRATRRKSVDITMTASMPRASTCDPSDVFVTQQDASFCFKKKVAQSRRLHSAQSDKSRHAPLTSSLDHDTTNCAETIAHPTQSQGPFSASTDAADNASSLPLLALQAFSQFAVPGLSQTPTKSSSTTLTARPSSNNGAQPCSSPASGDSISTKSSGLSNSGHDHVAGDGSTGFDDSDSDESRTPPDSTDSRAILTNQAPSCRVPGPTNVPSPTDTESRPPNTISSRRSVNRIDDNIDNGHGEACSPVQESPNHQSPAPSTHDDSNPTDPRPDDATPQKSAFSVRSVLKRFSPWPRIAQLAGFSSSQAAPTDERDGTLGSSPEHACTRHDSEQPTSTQTPDETWLTQLPFPQDPADDSMGLPFDPARECDPVPSTPPTTDTRFPQTAPHTPFLDQSRDTVWAQPRQAPTAVSVTPNHQTPWAPDSTMIQHIPGGPQAQAPLPMPWATPSDPNAIPSLPRTPWAGYQDPLPMFANTLQSVPRQIGQPRPDPTPPPASWKDVMLNQETTDAAPSLSNIDNNDNAGTLVPPFSSPPWISRLTTPQPTTSRPSTPKQSTPTPSEPYRIKPFSSFISPSPNHRVRKPRRSLKSAISSRHKKASHPWSAQSRRVSFVLSGNDKDDGGDESDEGGQREAVTPSRQTTGRQSKGRQFSPPPDTAIADIPEQDLKAAFSGHFSMMSRRVSGLRQRLVPTASQQARESPAHDAMARAFIDADGIRKDDSDVDMGDPDEPDNESSPRRADAPKISFYSRDADMDHESAASEIDIVDEVVSNIDSFLNPQMDDDGMDSDVMMSTPRVSTSRLPESQQTPWARGSILGM